MFLTIECKGPQDREWSTLNKCRFVADPDSRDGAAEIKRFELMLYGWHNVYFDHQIRLVKRK